MIRHVRIFGYKSLRKVDVRLQPLSVLFGPNAAGKSNFLDALQLLSRMVTSRTLNEAFEPPYRGTPLESFSFGSKGLAGQLEKDRLQFEIEVDVDLSERTVERVEKQIAEMRSGNTVEGKRGGYIKERILRYRLAVEILPRSGILRVADESLTALREDGEIKASRNAFIEKQGSRLHLRLEGQAHPTYHETGLDHTLVSRPLYPPHYPHIAAFRQELSDWAFFYFEPRERMRAVNPVKEVRHIGLMGEELAAFLNTLRAVDPRQFGAVEKSLRTLVPRIERIDVQPNALGEVELKLHEDGVPVPARLVSEGTLRMLGLLAVASAKEPSTLIAFEEPENGIHPRRIRLLAEFLKTRSQMGGTQFIVTTHSPLLPDLLPIEALYVCRRRETNTVIEPLHEGPLFKAAAIDSGLDDQEEAVPVSERILRGDFDG
ncbi:MAG: recombinase RecF [Betaproteobacteria bacterium RIFCSPLOWO2_12_FULL_62_13]|nr:MAG: recombinase RecF [Betaproteobacteria bacterium RIFCSPLOWO2_12_FULL_62_13]